MSATVLSFPGDSPDPDASLTAMQVVAAAGMTYRQLDFWTSTGRLTPINPDPGHGHHRTYSTHEARVAVTLARLVRAGLHIDVAATAARRMEDTGNPAAWLGDGIHILALPEEAS
jgi:DNA-binding transcriptional MerR regulator